MKLEYKVKQNNISINQILKNELFISSRLCYKLTKNKFVYLNGFSCDTRNIVHAGDLISIDLSYDEDNSNIVSTKMNLTKIYEDEWFIVLNKPSGIAVHPSILHYDNTLSNGLKHYFDSINLHKKIRPVNRLDFYTSGLIVFAKNEYIQECLIKQMSSDVFKKEYLAIVDGIFTKKQGTINKPIARKDGSIMERCISENGKPSTTLYKVLKEANEISLVRCKLKTGRTHQIRVHMASIGHPLCSDNLYGSKSQLLDNYFLFCNKLQFIHPVSHLPMKLILECDLPIFNEN